jgi:hypothetical protein
MKKVTIDRNMVSCCWLYCGACKKYLADKCTGCKKLSKTPFWCSIRDCCMEKGYSNCALCEEYPNTLDCKRYNGFVMRTLGYICGSDRAAATNMIKQKGIDEFINYMSGNKIQRIKRKNYIK